MRVALSIIAIDSSSGKPRPLCAATALSVAVADFATATGTPAAIPRRQRITAAVARPTMPIVAVAARHGISVRSQAVAAGNAILPRSPEKL